MVDTHSRQVVLDLETLSTRSNAAIVSIGAVAIENLEIVDEFYVNVDAKTCKEAGLHIDPLTVEWWAQQDMEARQALTVDPLPLDEAIDKFVTFFKEGNIWGMGANFDVVIMENAMTLSGWNSNRDAREKYPWKFWDIYCLRTLMNVLDKRLPKANNHNALDDAKAEADMLIEILKT
jgi:DNA polymerase III epsilon subunit-like protein